MKYDSEGFEGCGLEVSVAIAFKSALELVIEILFELLNEILLLELARARSFVELPTYKNPKSAKFKLCNEC